MTQAAGLVLLRNAHWHYSCRNLPSSLDGVTTSRDALGVSGAAMAVRTDWFLEGGGFDESFVNGFEDVDLCLRARERGAAIAYVAEARFAHYEGASAGRFDRERENEERFYRRWASRLAPLPRTQRGVVGAIAMPVNAREEPLLAAAREDLATALRAFGHPVVRGPLHRRRWFDRRFRQAASIDWFSRKASRPGIAIERRADCFPSIRTLGAIDIEVPWLPCASADQRVAACGVRRSERSARAPPSDSPALPEDLRDARPGLSGRADNAGDVARRRRARARCLRRPLRANRRRRVRQRAARASRDSGRRTSSRRTAGDLRAPTLRFSRSERSCSKATARFVNDD